jgi:hypothetical protein
LSPFSYNHHNNGHQTAKHSKIGTRRRHQSNALLGYLHTLLSLDKFRHYRLTEISTRAAAGISKNQRRKAKQQARKKAAQAKENEGEDGGQEGVEERGEKGRR